MAFRVVEGEGGTDRIGGHIHEHQIGDDARPIGEMRKVQSHRRPWCRLGRARSLAPADPAHRPHLEGVFRTVDEAGDRMGGVRGADGDPASLPVDPVLVIRDRRPAVVLWSLPGQRHRPICALRHQVCGRIRHCLSRSATMTASTVSELVTVPVRT